MMIMMGMCRLASKTNMDMKSFSVFSLDISMKWSRFSKIKRNLLSQLSLSLSVIQLNDIFSAELGNIYWENGFVLLKETT